MLALPADIADRNAWQRAAALAIEAGEQPTRDAIEALTAQLDLALFTTGRLGFFGHRSAGPSRSTNVNNGAGHSRGR